MAKMAPGAVLTNSRLQTSQTILHALKVNQALVDTGKCPARATRPEILKIGVRTVDSESHPEKCQMTHSKTSCKFKRQIKRFEKLMGQIQAQTHPTKLPRAVVDGDQPTFFFGEPARSQLVGPIGGDEHFENEASAIETLFAEQAQNLQV